MNDISGPLFETTIERDGDIAILRASGEIDVATAPTFANELAAASELARLVVVDLCSVSLIDSTGLGVLIEQLERLRGREPETELRLAISEPQILKVFAVTGLDNVFSIFSNASGAVAGR